MLFVNLLRCITASESEISSASFSPVVSSCNEIQVSSFLSVYSSPLYKGLKEVASNEIKINSGSHESNPLFLDKNHVHGQHLKNIKKMYNHQKSITLLGNPFIDTKKPQ